MILSPTINPDHSTYYLASFVLKVLLNKHTLPVDKLFKATVKLHPMTNAQFIQCLDWLYLIGTIELQKNQISICS